MTVDVIVFTGPWAEPTPVGFFISQGWGGLSRGHGGQRWKDGVEHRHMDGRTGHPEEERLLHSRGLLGKGVAVERGLCTWVADTALQAEADNGS